MTHFRRPIFCILWSTMRKPGVIASTNPVIGIAAVSRLAYRTTSRLCTGVAWRQTYFVLF